MSPQAALAALEVRAARDLQYLDFPDQEWVRPFTVDGRRVRDVVVVGGGLSGLGIAFGLLRDHIRNIEVIDRASPGLEGPWLTTARMLTLRTAKGLIGPDLGVPSLSFPAWYIASYGEAAWEALDLAPNAVWMAYLVWFRRVAAIPVRNGIELKRVRPHGDWLELQIEHLGADSGGSRQETWLTRKLVMATGLSSAGPILPEIVTANLPADRWAHSSDDIDFARLRGKRVAVLGAGASAFDNAAVALEQGAAAVLLFARRAQIAQPAVAKALEFSGLYRYFAELDDAQRWSIMRRLANHSTPPPPQSVERCTRHQRFEMLTSCAWLDVALDDGMINIETTRGPVAVDYIILGTGFSIEVAQRPELLEIQDDIARWSDVYSPPPGDDRPGLAHQLGRSPYLGPAFEYRAKPGRTAPWLRHIHDFGIASLLSMGRVSLGLPGMKFGPPRLVQGITRALFLEDADWHEHNLIAAEAMALADTPAAGSVV